MMTHAIAIREEWRWAVKGKEAEVIEWALKERQHERSPVVEHTLSGSGSPRFDSG